MTGDEASFRDDPRYPAGVALFNAGDYFEAHEVWEELWHVTRGAPRDFVQGLIQVTSALHHFRNGNLRGARILHDSGVELLSSYGPSYLGLDLEKVRRDFDRCLAGALESPLDRLSGRGSSGPVTVPFTPDRVFRMELTA